MVDFDSTMNDFDNHVINTLNDTFGSNYLPEHVTTWDFLREMDPDHVKHTWGEKMYHSREWTLSIPILPGVIEGVSNLLRAGYYLRVVTARTGKHLNWVEAWLDQHGMGAIPVTCVDKDTGDKAKWCRRYGYTIAIEDAPHHAMQLLETVDKVYLVEKLYNSHIGSKPHPASNLVRVKGLYEAAERIIESGIGNIRPTEESGIGVAGRADDAHPVVPGQPDQAIAHIRGFGVGAGRPVSHLHCRRPGDWVG